MTENTHVKLGEVFGPNECAMYTAVIDVDDHGAAIECNGTTREEAEHRRTMVMLGLMTLATGLAEVQEPKYTTAGGQIVNRATGEAIPEDEPIFILRARDRHAWATVAYYSTLVRDLSHRVAVKARADAFYAFIKRSPERMKCPDTQVGE